MTLSIVMQNVTLSIMMLNMISLSIFTISV
jgi:hypothetical protein